jgi:hypothetical protein
MHQGCVAAPTRVGGERQGGGRHRQALVGREEYYTRELATDHQQYLSGHGESPGRWYGAGASSLGLQGEASPPLGPGPAPRPGRQGAGQRDPGRHLPALTLVEWR